MQRPAYLERTACAAALLGALPGAVAAAGDVLGEIVVTARQPVVTRTSTTHTLDAAAIAVRGDHTLDQALEVIPGLNIRVGGRGEPRIDIRGLRTRHTKLLINGIPFNSSFDGQYDPTLIPSDQIERIKVASGGVSELYGAGAMAVINVVTHQRAGYDVEASGEFGEAGARRMSLSTGGERAGVDYFLGFSHTERDAFPLSDDFDPTSVEDGDERENSDRERTNGYASLSYSPSEDLRLGVLASVVAGEFGSPPGISDDNNDPFARRPRFDRVENQLGVAGQLFFDYAPAGPGYLRGWLYGNGLEQDENRYDDAGVDSIEERNSFLTTRETDSIGLGLQGGLSAPSWARLALAFDVHRDSWNQAGVIRDLPVAGGGGGGAGGGGGGGAAAFALRSLDNDASLWLASASAELELEPAQGLGLVFGAGRHRQDPEGLDSASAGSFLAGVHYTLFERTELNFSWSRKIRTPSIRQLYEEMTGNPDLNAEVLKAYEGGISHRFDHGGTLKFAVFHWDVDGFIERDDATDRFANIEKSRFRGIELSYWAQLGERLRLIASYSLLDSEDLGDSGREELQNRPEHLAGLDLDFAIAEDASGHLEFRYSADRFYYSRRGPLLKAELDDFALLDLRLRWRPGGSAFQFFAGVDNILDEDYEGEFGLPGPGRFVYGGVKFSL